MGKRLLYRPGEAVRVKEVVAMSASVHDQVDDRQIELGSEVNWTPILAALGVVGGVLVTVLGLLLLSGPRSTAETAEGMAFQHSLSAQDKSDTPAPPVEPKTQARVFQPLPVVIEPVLWVEPAPPKPVLFPPPPVVVKEAPPAPAVRPVPVIAYSPPGTKLSVDDISLSSSSEDKHKYFQGRDIELLVIDSRELDLEKEKGTTEKLLKDVPKTDSKRRGGATVQVDRLSPRALRNPAISQLLAQRTDLNGLPMQNLDSCQAGTEAATSMEGLSVLLRRTLRTIDTGDSDPLDRESEQMLMAVLEKKTSVVALRENTSVRILVQMLQAKPVPLRLDLVKFLSSTKSKSATAALVQRAVFDLSAEVRDAAVKALKDRPPAEWRSLLLEALRYPWPTVAGHAAEAFVALHDQEAVPNLVSLLDRPDPQAPTKTKDNKWIMAELVRVNHLGNCLLCHAPSASPEDPMRGIVPIRGEPLPAGYYASRAGHFVRADVTYLKQDFSVMLPVSDNGKWPKLQRFDFLIRHRELSDAEIARFATVPKGGQTPSYPQREAVLWALRGLTRLDLGARTEDWDPLLWDDNLWESW
jgi:HEAT repeats